MSTPRPTPAPDTLFGGPAPGPRPRPVLESVQFLAQFLGSTAQVERLQEILATHDPAQSGPALPPELLRRLFAAAGLVTTRLSTSSARRPTEMPALVLGLTGRSLVVVAMKGALFECHVPGIEGSTWLDAEAIAQEVPGGRWYAVRSRVFFDQRSLLYTLPEPAQWFWGVFRRNRGIFGWALLGTLALNLFGVLLPFYAMAVYDRVIPNNAMGSLGVLTSGVLLLMAFEYITRLIRSHLLETAARRMDVALSARVFAQCLRMRSTDRPASGGVLANTVRDFESVRDFFATTTLTVLGDLPFVLLYLAVIALVGGWLALVPLLAIPLLLGLAWAARRPLAKAVGEGMRESSQRTAHLFETMNALDTVKSLGAEAWSRRKWEGLTQAIATNTEKTRNLMTRTSYANATVMALVGVAVVGVGAVLVADQALTLGQIIAVSLLSTRALTPVSQIASLIVRWEQTKLSYQALNKIMAAATDNDGATLQAPPLTGRIEFREVSFAWPEQPEVVSQVSLRIKPGERVGVIGRLGSGKSTLLKLLLNQVSPTRGSVLVDDLVTTHLDALSLRRQMGYVPQDVTLFHGSLRENIEMGRSQTDDATLVQAMKTAGLDEVVAQLPEGPATQVGERGERLSGGQRQAVAMARALLAKPRVLLLDEPSSMLDPASEQKLIERLRALPDTTIVLVTHRMAMLALVDRLVVMDRGRVVADGPRDQVLKALAGGAGAAAPAAAGAARPAVQPAAAAPAGQAAQAQAQAQTGQVPQAAAKPRPAVAPPVLSVRDSLPLPTRPGGPPAVAGKRA